MGKYRKKTRILKAFFIQPPGIANTSKMRGSRRAGISFERKVGERLNSLFHEGAWGDVWIGYESSKKTSYCSPDFIVIDVILGLITVVECKLTHTDDAYYQLNNLYIPVVKKLFPGFEVRGVEVCKNFDRSTRYPVTPNIVSDFKGDWLGGSNVMVMR